jgi:predicted O-methyltransferase YrrM/2-polyprenyl-3-methyl-5-hydroxy-6-metoxy-1,4-benzoquinol methylase
MKKQKSIIEKYEEDPLFDHNIKYLKEYYIQEYPELVESILELNFTGFFSPENQDMLRYIIREKIKNIENPKILEIGSWKGLSSSIIGMELKKANKGKLICIDAWINPFKDDFDRKKYKFHLEDNEIVATFKHNMELLDLTPYVSIMYGISDSFHDLIKEQYFDIIFIDGDHTYMGAKNDIMNYLPKLKKDGLILGDDCEAYYEMLPKAFVDNHAHFDNYKLENSIEFHCGVIKALYEEFNEQYKIKFNSSVWVKDLAPKKDYLVEKCQICDNQKKFLNNFKNIDFIECDDCGYYYVNDIKSVNNLELIFNNDNWLNHRINMIEKFIKPKEKQNIFEIGCAKGEILNYYKNKGVLVSGCDSSNFARNLDLNIKSESIEMINLEQAYYDYFICFHTFEYIKDFQLVLEKIYNSLKKGGKLLFLIGLNNEPNDYEYNYFTISSLKKSVSKSKFVLNRVDFEIFRSNVSKIRRNAIIELIK